jgi:hypothetical protein
MADDLAARVEQLEAESLALHMVMGLVLRHIYPDRAEAILAREECCRLIEGALAMPEGPKLKHSNLHQIVHQVEELFGAAGARPGQVPPGTP